MIGNLLLVGEAISFRLSFIQNGQSVACIISLSLSLSLSLSVVLAADSPVVMDDPAGSPFHSFLSVLFDGRAVFFAFSSLIYRVRSVK